MNNQLTNQSCFKRFINCICCCCKKQKQLKHIADQLNFDTLYDFYGSPGKMCIAKVTLQNLLFLQSIKGDKQKVNQNEIYQKFINREQSTDSELESLVPFIFPYSYKITLFKTDIQKALPYCVTAFIARRIAQFTKEKVVDAFCGFGHLCIELAQQLIKTVEGYNPNLSKQENIEKNITFFHFYSYQRIHIISEQFLQRQEKADVIIIPTHHFRIDSNENNEKMLNYLHMEKVKPYLEVALKLSENIVLIIPNKITQNEIGTFLSQFSHKNEHSFRQIEIQIINLCGQTLCQVVYIGFIRDEEAVSKELQKCFLKQLLKDQKNIPDGLAHKYNTLLEEILGKIGYYQTMLLIEKCIAEKPQLDYLSTIFFQQVAQLKIIQIENNEKEYEYQIMEQTPTLNHPLMQQQSSPFSSGIQPKKQSAIHYSSDLLSSKNLSQTKSRIFSFQNKQFD